SVLLLEAGPDRRADMPPELRNGWTIEPEPFDWGYESEPHAGSVRPARRKKLLGGTSWLTRFTPRGSPADYDGWEALGVNTADAYLPSGRTPPNLTLHSAGRSTRETPDLMFWLADPEEDASFAIEVVLRRPRSPGTVRLRSTDPTDRPIIELPKLSDASDAERLADGYRRALEVANRPEVRRLCRGAAPTEPDDLNELIRAEEYSIPHVVGTCAMGPRPEDGAVVDVLGGVYGTERRAPQRCRRLDHARR